MRSKKAEDCLLRVRNYAPGKFPNLSFRPTYVNNYLVSLIASNYRQYELDRLTGHLPSLWVIMETLEGDDGLTVAAKLVNFQGNVIDTEYYDSENTVRDSNILRSLNNGEWVHCPGHSWIKNEMDVQEVPCLVERVGNSIVRRSFDCQTVVTKKNKIGKCKSCLNLRPKPSEADQRADNVAMKYEDFSDRVDDFDDDYPLAMKKLPVPATIKRSAPENRLKRLPSMNLILKKSPAKKTRAEPFDKVCKICLQRYSNEVYFKKDQIWHQKTIGPVDESIKCPTCYTFLEAKWSLTDHFAKAHPELGTCCCVCLSVVPLNVSSGENSLRKHFLEQHNTPVKTLVVCPTCGGSFTKKYLEVHIALKHTKVKSCVCEDCGKAFATENVLKSHRRSFHLTKNLQCTQCQRQFLRKPLFLQHLQHHTGKKPYQCSQCDYRSCRAYNVGLHSKKKHGKFLNIKNVIILQEEKDAMDSLVEEYLRAASDL